jgi:hypothetical protein
LGCSALPVESDRNSEIGTAPMSGDLPVTSDTRQIPERREQCFRKRRKKDPTFRNRLFPNRKILVTSFSGWGSQMSKDAALVEFWRKRAAKIEKALLNKAWTRAQLALKSGHDVRTIRTVLAGIDAVRDQTIVDICNALNIEPELEARQEVEIEVAEPWYGSYARDPYKSYEGAYFAYRRSFTFPDCFVRSVFEFKWHEEDWIFVFQEHQSYIADNKRKIDHSQSGEVYISQYTDLIHMVTVAMGAVRTVTLRKMRDNLMRGCILTQSDRGTYFQPCVSGIFLEKIFGFDAATASPELIGTIKPGHAEYEKIAEEMAFVERTVMFVAKPEGPQSL